MPSEWESKQLIKNITRIHTTPVHQLMSWEVKSCVLEINQEIHQDILTLKLSILHSIKKSVCTGLCPFDFKYAVVSPRLKRPNLAPDEMKNYRPISQLPFVSKILSKVVLPQLLAFWNENSILEMFLSGFKVVHSTETYIGQWPLAWYCWQNSSLGELNRTVNWKQQ